MKKVKTVKKRKFKKRLLLYAFLVFLGYELSFNLIMNFKLATNNEDFIKCLLADSNYHLLYEKKADDLFSKLFAKALDVNEPVSILENTFHYKGDKVDTSTYVNSVGNNIVEGTSPAVYIYNSHQAEEYQGEGLDEYNIKPGVMMASYILQDKLEKAGVSSLVLEDNLIDYMNLNNMSHAKSYEASRTFVSAAIKDNI